MEFNNILVPYDGSEHAKSALLAARGIAEHNPNAKIFILSVVPSARLDMLPPVDDASSRRGRSGSSADLEEFKSFIDRAMYYAEQDVRESYGDAMDGFDGDFEVEAVANSSIVRGITEYAAAHDIDIIIMGRRGLDAIRGMLGSVSYGVLRSTEIPVLTVK